MNGPAFLQLLTMRIAANNLHHAPVHLNSLINQDVDPNEWKEFFCVPF
jgi:hypothetical protein